MGSRSPGRVSLVATKQESPATAKTSQPRASATPGSGQSSQSAPTALAKPSLPLQLPGPLEFSTGPPAPGPTASAAEWRQFADQCVKLESFAAASKAYRQEASLYKKLDPNAARIEELKAASYSTEIQLYQWQSSGSYDRPLERLEPTWGCKVGAFIDRDDSLRSHNFSPRIHGDIDDFNRKTGVEHSSFFTYVSVAGDFPGPWCRYVLDHSALVHIAWEPDNLAEVTDETLKSFVDQLRKFNGPVLLRFASEMNGDWTPYSKDPAEYRRVFRKVYQALRFCPKAALLWCPNAIPEHNIDAYYPGDDYCDWVGVNFYSVPFLDNDPKQPADKINPVDLLEPVYRKYSERKPICIGEFAASHQSAGSATLKNEFATSKIAQLYQALPLRYPRVKLVSWYDCNNLVNAPANRQLNNFLLTDQPEVTTTYRSFVQQNWYLKGSQSSSRERAKLCGKTLHCASGTEFEPLVRSYINRPKVYVRWRGKVIYAYQAPSRARFSLPAVEQKAAKLEILVFDDKNRLADRSEYLIDDQRDKVRGQ